MAWLALLWGLAEATVFFIVPDVLISRVAAKSLARAWWACLFATVGAVVGGVGMYAWANASPATARRVVDGVPFVPERTFASVETDLEGAGVLGVFRGPLLGRPYKVYAILAPRHVGAMPFTLTSIPARAARFVILALIGAAFGLALRRWTRAPDRWIVVVHAGLWTIFYLFYWSRQLDTLPAG